MRQQPGSSEGGSKDNRAATSKANERAARRFRARLMFDPVYEKSGDELLSFPRFLGRVGLSFALTWALVAIALSIGVLGYRFIGRLQWIDALLNASMILTGMGPVDTLHTPAAKIFASGYALFSGVVFLTSVGIVLAPVFHRVVHKFHLDDSEKGDDSPAGR